MKFPTTQTLTLSVALALGCGAAFADETKPGPAHPKSERETECQFVRGKKLDSKFKFSDLDGDHHTLKSYMDEGDVLVISFVSLEDIYGPAKIEKDEWVNEKTQSKLTKRLAELKTVMKNEKIKAADKSVAYMIVVLTHDGFKPTTIRPNADGRTLGNLIEVYFEEHGLDKAWIATTPKTQARDAFGLPYGRLATVIAEKGRVHYARFTAEAKPDAASGTGAMADAKRLKAKEAEPNPGAKADAKRLKAKDAKQNRGAKFTAKTSNKKLGELKNLDVALLRVVTGQVSLPASTPRGAAIERAREAERKAIEQAEQTKREAAKRD